MEICYLHDVVSIYGCIISTYVTSNDEVILMFLFYVVVFITHKEYTFPLGLYSSIINKGVYGEVCYSVLLITCRIYKYFNCSSECYLLSLIYIDRLIRLDSFVINGYSVYRVVLTSYCLYSFVI